MWHSQCTAKHEIQMHGQTKQSKIGRFDVMEGKFEADAHEDKRTDVWLTK